MALIHYVQGLKKPGTSELLPIDQRSLGAIYKMLSSDSFAQIEQIMGDLPNTHPAKAPYGIFRLANRQIWGNIAIGLGNRLGVFQNESIDKITKYNEIDLELPGRKPCAYFCIISDQDSSLEFLSSLFFSTLFVRLTNYARRYGENGRLPVKVNVCLDEFCNVGKILDFKKIISTVRSRGINCQVIVQSAAQLSDRYEKKEGEELVGNCDTQLFLGCNDQMTADYFSKKCGMVTIKVENNQMPLMPLFSPILNTTRPYSQTKSNTQRALMLPDEILRMPNEQALVLLRGQKPLMLYKIIPDELPLFKRLSTSRIIDYAPVWRQMEDEKSRKIAEEKIIITDAPMPEKQERPVGGTVKYSLAPEIIVEAEEFSEDIDELEGLFATEEASPDEIIGK
jgi:type IV secretion system protein VirD4